VEGDPIDIWNRIHSEIESRPHKKNLLSKLFSR